LRGPNSVAPDLLADDLPLDTRQQQLSFGQSQTQMCEVAEIMGQIDLHDVRVLLHALSVNFHQPQDPGHAFILDRATAPRIPRRHLHPQTCGNPHHPTMAPIRRHFISARGPSQCGNRHSKKTEQRAALGGRAFPREAHARNAGKEPVLLTAPLHRPLTAADNLDEILAWWEERTVTLNLTLQYDQMMLLLDPTPFARGLMRKKVEVVNYPDGRFAIQFEGTPLPFRVFDKIQTVQPGTIVENKRLGAALALVKEQQATYAPHRRRYDPARGRPPNNLE